MELYKEGEEKFGFCTSRLYEAIPKYFLRELYDSVIRDVQKYSPASILDVGCGTANVDKIIAQKFPDVYIYAIDPSEYMVKIAENKLKKYGTRVHISQGSSRYIPFDMKFDMIFSSLSFHHWKCREKGLEEMSKYVSETGFIAIYEYYKENLHGIYRGVKGHTLSMVDIEELSIQGFSKNTNINGKIVSLMFTRAKNSQ
ncbi:MAG: class I SAM-dependent methyltransferase [Thermoplasmata archaeon]